MRSAWCFRWACSISTATRGRRSFVQASDRHASRPAGLSREQGAEGAARMIGLSAAHGDDPGPTQRPLLAGAVSGVLATIPAIAFLYAFGSLAVEARILGLSELLTIGVGLPVMAVAGAFTAACSAARPMMFAAAGCSEWRSVSRFGRPARSWCCRWRAAAKLRRGTRQSVCSCRWSPGARPWVRPIRSFTGRCTRALKRPRSARNLDRRQPSRAVRTRASARIKPRREAPRVQPPP